MNITILVANDSHFSYAGEIVDTIREAAQHRGTGIAERTPEYIQKKMSEGKAIIALGEDSSFAGFCYIESWQDKQFVATSGLIVSPNFRNQHLAKRIKAVAVDRAREMFPGAKLFGITTSAAVMKINTDLGYRPVHFSELPQDDVFWRGCESCPNHDILERTKRNMCLCTAMLHKG